MSSRPPWIDEDGATDPEGWIAAYLDDDNVFWRTDTGHLMNVIDYLIDRLGIDDD